METIVLNRGLIRFNTYNITDFDENQSNIPGVKCPRSNERRPVSDLYNGFYYSEIDELKMCYLFCLTYCFLSLLKEFKISLCYFQNCIMLLFSRNTIYVFLMYLYIFNTGFSLSNGFIVDTLLGKRMVTYSFILYCI